MAHAGHASPTRHTHHTHTTQHGNNAHTHTTQTYTHNEVLRHNTPPNKANTNSEKQNTPPKSRQGSTETPPRQGTPPKNEAPSRQSTPPKSDRNIAILQPRIGTPPKEANGEKLSPPVRHSTPPKSERSNGDRFSPPDRNLNPAPNNNIDNVYRNERAPPDGEEANKAPSGANNEKVMNKAMPKFEHIAPAAKIEPVKPPRVSSIESTEPEEKNERTKNENEESNGVGDKIKKFEKAAEDASANVGRLSRPGSIRGRSRTERLGSDSKEDPPPPVTTFKDTNPVETALIEKTSIGPTVVERQQSLARNTNSVKWQRSDSNSTDGEKPKPEPQRIIKPEFKPMASPVDVTIRSPSLGAKIPDRFPSHGTAFRNVASKPDDELKPCKLKTKEKYSVSKGSSYFTRGSEEIWLVKKKDIEEIEERVLDSFRRAGGNVCMSARPSSEGQAATMGRVKRATYARSESLDPQRAGARAHTLKRQTSVACTCGHDKKTRPKQEQPQQARPRSRSHGDDNAHGHVLDKYETLV